MGVRDFFPRSLSQRFLYSAHQRTYALKVTGPHFEHPPFGPGSSGEAQESGCDLAHDSQVRPSQGLSPRASQQIRNELHIRSSS